jgi:hypothetical protein
MSSTVSIKYDDLLSAVEWVSTDIALDNGAMVSRLTGKIHWTGADLDDMEEETPEDIDDGTIYVPVPEKKELDLGQQLALDFAHAKRPRDFETVAGFFRKRGAYRNFKDWLDRQDLLDDWYAYEAEATKSALKAWCEENDLKLAD